MDTAKNYPAPEWITSQWFNTKVPLSVAGLQGRVIVVGAFQMLCPGCVAHGLPQLQKIERLFSKNDVLVVGLHTVFEHHEAMMPVSLAAFLHEYRIGFPIGVDAPGPHGDPMPQTMGAYEMRGTPTTLLIDRAGIIRRHYFGQVDDLQLGADIMALVMDRAPTITAAPISEAAQEGCGDQNCPV